LRKFLWGQLSAMVGTSAYKCVPKTEKTKKATTRYLRA